MSENESQPIGRVLGTESATPLDWWVAIEPDQFLQLDDVVLVRTRFLARTTCASPASSTWCARSTRAAASRATCFLPSKESAARDGPQRSRCFDAGRARALGASTAGRPRCARRVEQTATRRCISMRWSSGLSQGYHATPANLSSTSPSWMVAAAPTSTFPASPASRPRRPTRASCCTRSSTRTCSAVSAANTKALVFNVKGEDLLFLDEPNDGLSDQHRARYEQLGLPAGPFDSVGIWAPVRRNVDTPVPDTGSRQEGVRAYFWTVRDVVREGLLRFMFAEAGDERSQIADLVTRVEAALQREAEDVPDSPCHRHACQRRTASRTHVKSFDELCELIDRRSSDGAFGLGGLHCRRHDRGVPPAPRRRSPPLRPPDPRRRRCCRTGEAPDRLGVAPGLGDRHPQPA